MSEEKEFKNLDKLADLVSEKIFKKAEEKEVKINAEKREGIGNKGEKTIQAKCEACGAVNTYPEGTTLAVCKKCGEKGNIQ